MFLPLTMSTIKRSKQDIWQGMASNMIETSKFIRPIFNTNLVSIEELMKGLTIFGFTIHNFFQGLMMATELCLSPDKWFSLL